MPTSSLRLHVHNGSWEAQVPGTHRTACGQANAKQRLLSRECFSCALSPQSFYSFIQHGNGLLVVARNTFHFCKLLRLCFGSLFSLLSHGRSVHCWRPIDAQELSSPLACVNIGPENPMELTTGIGILAEHDLQALLSRFQPCESPVKRFNI